MEKSLHRKILIGSFVGIFIITTGLISAIVTGAKDVSAGPLFIFLYTFPLSSIITLYAIKLKDKSWARRIAKYSLYALPVPVALVVFLTSTSGFPVGVIILTVFAMLFFLLTWIHIFVYADATSVSGVIIILTLLVAGIFMKRNHILYSGIIISLFSMFISVGSFMFGIRCLFLAENITYFRNVSFWGGCVISIAFLGQLFKLQHWGGAGIFSTIGLIFLIIGTLYFLLTLHSSGFIDWKPFHKKILRRILIPWTFIFILYISRYMVPELNTIIWSPDTFIINRTVPAYGFGMKDYTISNIDSIKQE